MRKVKCIMLVDDNPHDNFFHERVIRQCDAADTVIVRETGLDALLYLKAVQDEQYVCPDIIILDINMPGMDGWEFLEEYMQLDPALQSKMIVIMLTTSNDPRDRERAERIGVLADFRNKPLTKEMLEEILDKYYTEVK